MPIQTYTDREVVAALNSVIDWDKYKALPPNVRDRLHALIKYRRIGKSCTFDRLGFALRVFRDQIPPLAPGESGNESDVLNDEEADKVNRVALDSTWVRCPKELFQIKTLYFVMDEKGQHYVGLSYRPGDPTKTPAPRIPAPHGEDIDEDDTEDLTKPNFDWRSLRRNAKGFERPQADEIARLCNGVVVKA